MCRYIVSVALLLVVVPLAVVVSEEVPNDGPAFCLLVNGVSWLPVDSLPHALRQRVTDETPTQVMNGTTLVPIKRFVEAQGGTVGWDGSAGLVMVEFEDQVLRLKALHSESFWQAQKGGPGTSPSMAIGQIPSRPCYKDDCGLYWVTPELLPKPLQGKVTDNTPGVTYQGVFAVSLKHFAQEYGAKFHEDERSVSVTFEGGTTAYMPLGLNTFLWQVGKRPEHRPPPRKPGKKGATVKPRQIFYELVWREDRMDMEAARKYICDKYHISRSELLQIIIRGGQENWPMPPYAGP